MCILLLESVLYCWFQTWPWAPGLLFYYKWYLQLRIDYTLTPISIYNERIYYWCNCWCSPHMWHLVHICPSQGEAVAPLQIFSFSLFQVLKLFLIWFEGVKTGCKGCLWFWDLNKFDLIWFLICLPRELNWSCSAAKVVVTSMHCGDV